MIQLGPIVWILLALSAVATGLSWAITVRRPVYRPIAWTLSYFIASDVLRYLLQPSAPGPYQGWDRVAFHIRSILFIGWRFAIAALAIWVFARRRPWPIALAFVAASVVLVAGYPTIRGELLQQVYLAIELSCLCISLGCLIPWFRSTEPRGLQHLVTGVLIVSEMVMVAGPYTGSIYLNWDRAWAILLVGYLALCTFQGAAWFRIYSQR